jgi:hypothetical protein
MIKEATNYKIAATALNNMLISAIYALFFVVCHASPVPSYIIDALSQVQLANGSVYGLHDDSGHSMDSVRVQLISESQPSFFATYHTLDVKTSTFNIHIAASDNLTNWHWKGQIAANADMPYVALDAAGSQMVLLTNNGCRQTVLLLANLL